MADLENQNSANISNGSACQPPSSAANESKAGDRPSRPSRRRRIVVRLLIIFAAAIGVLAAGETVLRLCVGPSEVAGYPLYTLVPDPFTGVRYAPNLHLRLSYGEKGKRFRFTTNALGFRGREVSWAKSPGAFRVLFLGDSFTEGFGVNDDETFPYYFEEIARRMDKNIEVINAGQRGCELPEYLGFLRGYGARLAPDLVVISLFADNGFYISGPNDPPPRWGVAYGRRQSRSMADSLRCCFPDRLISVCNPRSRGAALDRWLHRNSLFYRWFSDLTLRLPPCRAAMAKLGWIEDIVPVQTPVSGQPAPPVEHFLREKQNSDVEAEYETEIKYLTEIKNICANMGAQPFIQMIPDRSSLPRFESLWNDRIEQWRASWEQELGRPLQPQDVNKILPTQQLSQIIGRVGAHSANLTQLAFDGVLYDEFHQITYAAPGGHFSPRDNLFDALVLLGALIDRRLLPPSITTEKFKAIWQKDFSHVQLPFFPPDPPEVKGGQVILWGEGRGTVVSSLDTTGGQAALYEVHGFFSPLANIQPPCERAKKGDFITYSLRVPDRPTTARHVLAVEICNPAIDPHLDRAARRSLWWGNNLIQESFLASSDVGRWEPLALSLVPDDKATTLTIRIEAMRDFERAPTGEFPLLLRMRHLRIYRADGQLSGGKGN